MDGATYWLNGRIVESEAAVVPLADHGLLYGDGVFEGIRYYNGTPFRLEAHLDRLTLSARALTLPLAYDRQALTDAVAQTISAAGGRDGYLRLVVTRGAGSLGLDPRSCSAPNTFIIAAPLSLASRHARQSGARVIIAATRRLPADGLDPRVKSLNYLNHVLARMEANHAGADEAILLNRNGLIAEGTADNVFIVRDGVLLTPPAVDGALEGITRDLVLELAQSAGLNARESSLAPYDLYTADECFLTGTGAELIPVGEVDGRTLPGCPGPLFTELTKQYRETIARECAG